MRQVARALPVILLAGCATALPRATLTLEAGTDPRVGTYVSKPWGFSTSSYWIEGPDGLVLIDTQFLPSAALEAVTWAEQVTGKKVVTAIVLHPNPDKYNGTTVLQARGIEVLTSAQVAAAIPAVHEGRKRSFYARYKPDYPADAPVPTTFGSTTTTLARAGLELTLHVLGPVCSADHVVVEWQGHLFPGDLVTNDGHAWLELGLVEPWMARLDELRARKIEHVHPGRGPSGSAGLLDAQKSYLSRVLAIVDALEPARPDDAAGIARATAQVLEAYPGYALDVFVSIGMPAVWNARAALTATPPAARSSTDRRGGTDAMSWAPPPAAAAAP